MSKHKNTLHSIVTACRIVKMTEAVDAERPQLLMAAEAYIKNIAGLKNMPVTLSAETPHVRVQLEFDEHNLWHPTFFKQLTDEKLKLQVNGDVLD